MKSDLTAAAPAPLAVIGIGCLFPKADNLGAYWANIKNGVDAITDIPPTHWRVADYYAHDPKSPDRTYGTRGGFLSPVDFNPMEFGIPPNVLEATDTSQLLGMMAAGEALKDAGYGPASSFDRERVSVILGVTGALELVIPLGARLGHPIWRSALKEAGVDENVAEDVVQRISDSYVQWQENSFPGLLGNVVAGRISKQFDLGGTNCVVDAACASSLGALHLAGLELSSGRADMVVTGGVDTFNDIFMYMCFTKTPALSPTGDAKPFDAKGDGTILGEGLGMVVLKRLADAERDGDRIYAVVRGIGSSSDGKGEAIYAPSAAGQKKSLAEAYRLSFVPPDTIELVEAHGTGTKVGDAVEVAALREVYGEAENGPWCALGSVKSQIGHAKAAAGAAGIIKTVLALHHKVLPPTIKVEQPLKEVTSGRTPFYINTEKRPWLPRAGHPRRAAVSAFGFGGSNFHCVLEEYQPQKTSADWDGNVQILSFSAENREGLSAALDKLPGNPSWNGLRRSAAASRAAFRTEDPCRLALVVEKDKTNFAGLLESAKAMLRRQPQQKGWSTPDGAFFSSSIPGKLGMLFPGQGAQYTGMLRDLACHFPQMLDALAKADPAFAHAGGKRLSDLIYPHPAFSEEAKAANEAALRATDAAQPAIGAVSLGALHLLASFGVRPDTVAGHSYGELTALCAAGRLDETSLHTLSATRGRLMAEGKEDSGTMLAVSAPLTTVEEVLSQEGGTLVIANKNAPNQAVLSGTATEIAKAEKAFASRNISCTRLPVAAAFHSPLVAEASVPFLAALEDIPFFETRIPVFSNTTAREYPADAAEARALLASQLAKPVEFVAQIESMYGSGVRTFLEVGPGARLTGLVKAILGAREHEALAMDASGGRRSGLLDMARVLAQLAVLGYPVKLSLWDEGFPEKQTAAPGKKPALTVPICGANHVKPRQKRAPAEKPAPKSQPTGGLADALRMTQEGMVALQKLQEQTAQLHRQFLESQEAAGRTFQALLEQQQRLFSGGGVPRASAPAVPPLSPAFVPAPEPLAAAMTAPAIHAGGTPPAREAASSDLAAQTLLQVISDKTGYPVEMLELDMGLDSDLGIDSIKRVEILSALQERLPEAPAIRPEHLGTLQTLRQIVAHLSAGSPSITIEGNRTGIGAPARGAASSGLAAQALLQVISDKTGYPVEMLELDMGLDSDLGIDSIKRVEILSALQERLPDAPAIRPEHLGTLQTLRQIVAHLSAGSPSITIEGNRTGIGAPARGAASSDLAAQTLLQVISDKTGYPVEMLELDMGLDSDLGIDSIKRVEILSALQERLPDAPAIRPEHLGTLQTLRQIVAHLSAGSPSITIEGNRTGIGAPAREAASSGLAAQTLLQVISDKTGYPVEMLELDMGLDSDLGIDSIKRVEILSALQERLPEAPAIRPEHLGTLQTLRQIVAFISGGVATAPDVPGPQAMHESASPEPQGEALPLERSVLSCAPLENIRRETLTIPKGAELWVATNGSPLAERVIAQLTLSGYRAKPVSPEDTDALQCPGRLGGLVILSPQGGTDDAFLKNAFKLLQIAAPGLKACGAEGGAVFATVSRLDGCFGLSGAPDLHDPLSGGLAGLAKTARHEWPAVSCKALDLADDFMDTELAAKALVEEMFLAGPVEVGLSRRGPSALRLFTAPIADTRGTTQSDMDGVVVVSGGGRGVTAAVAVALARKFRPILLLLGRSPEPGPEPAWLAPLSDEAAIKRALLERAGGKIGPRQIEEEFRSLMANRELQRTLSRIEAAGSKALYRSLDICDTDAVRSVIAEARRIGPIIGLIHGAGVLADRRIEDKTLDQFELVYSTKVAGLRALLGAVESDGLKFMALFSSSTGRFGRTGQADYAVANEVLNKLALQQAMLRPACRVVAINWGPWDGGMVTPPLKKLFADEGVGLIGLEAGAEHFIMEIGAPPGAPVEVVVLGGGTGVKPVARPTELPPSALLTTAFELELSIERYPFLTSHVMDGKAVLPMAMIVEWLAHGALHSNPGLKFHGFNDLRICKGVIFDRDKPCTVRVMTGKAQKRDAFHQVPVELQSTGPDGRNTINVQAGILLATRLPEGIRSITEVATKPYPRQEMELYNQGLLFHGPDFQGIERVDGCSGEGIVAAVKSAPAPSQWIKAPLRSAWLTDPLALDSSFQLMILWSFEKYGKGSLPCFAGRYRQFQEAFPKDGTEVVIRITRESERGAMADMEFFDRHTGKMIARMEDYECVIDASLNRAFQRNQLPQQVCVELGAA